LIQIQDQETLQIQRKDRHLRNLIHVQQALIRAFPNLGDRSPARLRHPWQGDPGHHQLHGRVLKDGWNPLASEPPAPTAYEQAMAAKQPFDVSEKLDHHSNSHTIGYIPPPRTRSRGLTSTNAPGRGFLPLPAAPSARLP
jgi:hypothetical protein